MTKFHPIVVIKLLIYCLLITKNLRKDLSLERLQVSGALILAWCSGLRKVSENPFIKIFSTDDIALD